MYLLGINIGQKQIQIRRGRVEETGIYKSPVTKSVKVTHLGLEKDVIVSKRHHGGPDQAVYVYGAADYEWWSEQLRKVLAPGTFGENLTISELQSAQFHIGDYLHLKEVTLQVTAPRIPCNTFATRMNDPQWVKKFRAAERPGLYCRVIKEGNVSAGEVVSVERYQGETLSLLEMFRDYYDRDKSEEAIRRHLNAPIAIRARRELEREIQERFAQQSLKR